MKITKDESAPKLELVEVVLMHFNVVNNNYQQSSKVLFTFVSNKQLGQLITISPDSLTMLNTTNTEFSFIETWFTDQNNRPLEVEDNVNITLIVFENNMIMHNYRVSTLPRDQKYIKEYGFLPFARNFANKYDKKLMGTGTKTVKNVGMSAAKTASKRAYQKTTEATSYLIGNQTTDKINSVSK